MMRSMFTGVSGLVSHQQKMDVIGNNLANVNTVGYKASSANFSDVFRQTVSSGSGETNDGLRKASNPVQVGLGVQVASINKLFTKGSAQLTDNPLDVMIQGDGFLIVGNKEASMLTRAGNMNFDAEGNLMNNGYRVYGWQTAFNEETGAFDILNKTKVVSPIAITEDMKTLDPTPTTETELTGNLNFKERDQLTSNVQVYDDKGVLYSIPLVFKYNEDAENWEYEVEKDESGSSIMYRNGNIEDPVPASFSTDGLSSILGTLSFDSNGKLSGVNSQVADENGKVKVDLKISAENENGEQLNFGIDSKVSIDFTNITQFSQKGSVKSEALNGSSSGILKETTFTADGVLTGHYSNGKTRPLAQLALCKVDNPAGLESRGDSLFSATVNSGGFNAADQTWRIHEGRFQSGVLEMSNVDVATEFTDMITTQRGFQANSKIISVSDQMLQSAISMKK